jgi:hypothetical protein
VANLKGPHHEEGTTGRREPRVSVDLHATLGGRTARPAHVVDINALGCLLRTDFALDPGAVVDVRIELPDGPMPAKARVAESSLDGAALSEGRRYLVGLEFLGAGAREEQRLRAFVEEESKRRRGANPPAP